MQIGRSTLRNAARRAHHRLDKGVQRKWNRSPGGASLQRSFCFRFHFHFHFRYRFRFRCERSSSRSNVAVLSRLSTTGSRVLTFRLRASHNIQTRNLVAACAQHGSNDAFAITSNGFWQGVEKEKRNRRTATCRSRDRRPKLGIEVSSVEIGMIVRAQAHESVPRLVHVLYARVLRLLYLHIFQFPLLFHVTRLAWLYYTCIDKVWNTFEDVRSCKSQDIWHEYTENVVTLQQRTRGRNNKKTFVRTRVPSDLLANLQPFLCFKRFDDPKRPHSVRVVRRTPGMFERLRNSSTRRLRHLRTNRE